MCTIQYITRENIFLFNKYILESNLSLLESNYCYMFITMRVLEILHATKLIEQTMC